MTDDKKLIMDMLQKMADQESLELVLSCVKTLYEYETDDTLVAVRYRNDISEKVNDIKNACRLYDILEYVDRLHEEELMQRKAEGENNA